MNKLLLSMCLVLAPGMAIAADADDVTIKKISKDFVTAWNAGDAAALAAFYASDAVLTTPGGQTSRGQDAIQAAFTKDLHDMEGGKLALSGEEFQLLGTDAAVWRCDWKLTGTKNQPASGGTGLAVLKRSANGWRIIEDLVALTPAAPAGAKKKKGDHGHDHGEGGHSHGEGGHGHDHGAGGHSHGHGH